MPSILFIADKFSDAMRTPEAGHPGGAELTDKAAIEAAPYPVTCVTFDDLSSALLDAHDIHIIGNSSTATVTQLCALARAGRHVLFEHDVRICRWRGNFPAAKEPVHRYHHRCVCPHLSLRALYATAQGAIFLTHRQLAVFEANPFFCCGTTAVVGCSLFDEAFFERVETLAGCARPRRRGWWVLGSRQLIKGTKQAMAYCRIHGHPPRVIRGLEPDEVLNRLEGAERFVYLPIGLEPAGRMVVEARWLGADVVVNEHVGVAGESWWHAPDAQGLAILRDGPARFWRLVEEVFA